jgi:hypothetical protein
MILIAENVIRSIMQSYRMTVQLRIKQPCLEAQDISQWTILKIRTHRIIIDLLLLEIHMIDFILFIIISSIEYIDFCIYLYQ